MFYVMSCMFRITKGKEREGGREGGGRRVRWRERRSVPGLHKCVGC